MVKDMSKISRDVIFSGKKAPAGRSTTSSRACNQAQTIQSCKQINLLLLTANQRPIFTKIIKHYEPHVKQIQKMIKDMSTISRDVIFSGKKAPAGRSTTSPRACNQAQTIQSCQNINLLPLTASR